MIGAPQQEQEQQHQQQLNQETVLVTGGAGYIGSHTVVELLAAGFHVIVVDNLSNSSEESLKRVAQITQSPEKITFYKADIRDHEALTEIFSNHQHQNISSVIHFAGLKSVSESISQPLDYYSVNVTGTCVLLKVMKAFGCNKIVFSSSATVYGHPQFIPLTESHPLDPINPYGRSKHMAELVIKDFCTSQNNPKTNTNTNPNQLFQGIALRYFNPIGAHPSGLIGESPTGIPNNLVPYVTQVMTGKLPHLNVFGADYKTRDGTGVRDFIHVVDLARGHVAALLSTHNTTLSTENGFKVYNMGTGNGYSVFEIVKAMEQVSGLTIPIRVQERRVGDAGEVVASPGKANGELGWVAGRSIVDMCETSWRWQKGNPDGYV
ncbi:UDP-glucose 4-epimerase [Obelidium mucronatum]|nr:UDP-glucose 4-epimerase [Obelidium mucronatum]